MIDNEEQEENQLEPALPGTEHSDPIKSLRSEFSPILAVVLALGGGFLLYQIFGSLLTLLIFGTDFKNADMNAFRLMQVGGQVLFMLLPTLIIAKRIYKNVTVTLRFRMPQWKEILLFSSGALIMTNMVNGLMAIQQYWFQVWVANSAFALRIQKALEFFDKMLEDTYKSFMTVQAPWEVVIVILAVAVTPAICEEFLFRGLVQSSLYRRYSNWTAAVITAMLFAVLHLNPSGIIGLFILGLFFGWSAYKSNSIVIPVIMHFMNNFIAFAAFTIVGNSEIALSEKMTDTDVMHAYAMTGSMVLLFIGFLTLIHGYYRKNVPSEVV